MLISRSGLSRLAAAALLVAFAAAPSMAKERESYEKTVPFNLGGYFRIENVNGDITIEVWNEASVRIQAEKVADSVGSLEKIEILVEGEGDRVEVKTRLPRSLFRGGSRKVDYRISLPAEAIVNASSVNGQVEIQGIHGQVEASTVNGSIEVYDVAGVVDISTTNGSIKASYVEAGDGHHRFSTTNGSVTLYLPPDAGGELDVDTVNGSISTDFPSTIEQMSKRHLKGTFGGGGGFFEISTVNGSVKIRKS